MNILSIKENLALTLNIDKNEKIINFVQTVQGKISLCLLFSLCFFSVNNVSFKNPI